MRFLLISLFLAGAIWAASDNPAVNKQVMAAVEEWKRATLAKDRQALDRILHADLIYTHSTGKTEDKTEFIKAVTGGPSSIEAITLMDPIVRVYGNAALVKSKMDIRNNSGGNVSTAHLDVLMVWIRTKGLGWQLVARQATRLQQ
jgi:ketosteroid isomerase-like protein